MEVQKQKENRALKLCNEIKVRYLAKDHQLKAYCRVLKYKIGIKSR
jgi:hypothetical protein